MTFCKSVVLLLAAALLATGEAHRPHGRTMYGLAHLDRMFPVPISFLLQYGGGMGGLAPCDGCGAMAMKGMVQSEEPIELDLGANGGMGIHDISKLIYPVISLEATLTAKSSMSGSAGRIALNMGVNNPGSMGIAEMMGLSRKEVDELTPPTAL